MVVKDVVTLRGKLGETVYSFRLAESEALQVEEP